MILSVLMPYMNRPLQLSNTLMSYNYHGGHDMFEIVIIEDVKNLQDSRMHQDLIEVVDQYRDLTIRVIPSIHDCRCTSCKYNIGAQYAFGEGLVLTCPECLPTTNVIQQFRKELLDKKSVYVVGACMNGSLPLLKNFSDVDGTFIPDRVHPWYQHSVEMPRNLNFLTTIRKEDYLRLGGFDERYCSGLAMEDDAFRQRVFFADPKIFINTLDDILCIHQSHSRSWQEGHETLREINREIYRASERSNKW